MLRVRGWETMSGRESGSTDTNSSEGGEVNSLHLFIYATLLYDVTNVDLTLFSSRRHDHIYILPYTTIHSYLQIDE